MKRNKGFTLIELLVVIAIIGILSAIVLASLGSARTKAQDAKIQSQLAGMRAAAEIYSSSNGNKYATAEVTDCALGMFADETSGMNALIDATASTSAALACKINAAGTAWAVSAQLVSDTANYWCVDSIGKSLQVSAAPGAVTVCPAI